MVNREQFIQTKPYEGPAGGLGAGSDAGSETFAANRAGRATFKVKQEEGKESASGTDGGDKDK